MVPEKYEHDVAVLVTACVCAAWVYSLVLIVRSMLVT